MNITTKAEPGQTIFYLLKARVHSAPIQNVNIHAYVEGSAMGEPRTGVTIEYKTCHGKFNEDNVYLSREELAQAILEEKI